jgi:actin-like ATPase involved in cell morphogenesis
VVLTLMEHSQGSQLPVEAEVDTAHSKEFLEELRRVTDVLPERINIDAESVEQGLAKLVLTVIEFIRRLLEKQAIRRVESGNLTPEQVEALGLALMKLEAKLQELKTQFGLAEEDLNLNLGPLGRLI